MTRRSWPGKIASFTSLVTSGLILFRLIVLCIGAKLHGGEPCPFGSSTPSISGNRRRIESG